ncbi:Hsp20/alpha crystallin family protein [Halopelagius fulvigenes]|uniref:Hsp20/alpha crystallin family protein n=1 Tax=Halopelagius fulvigenes TaxID=1198324 RepID=A0ABD5TYH6_9EURY
MLPTTTSWTQGLDLPGRTLLDGPFANRPDEGYELYEEDDAFVLSIDVPGFGPEEIDLRWHDGRLTVAAEHVDEERSRKKTYHRSFRLPKRVAPEEAEASYHNGLLEVRLPIEGEMTRGTEIPIEG